MLYKSVALVAAATLVAASPVAKPVSIPLSQVSNVKSAKGMVAHGQSRLSKFNKDSTETSSGTVTNDDVSYVAGVSIGGTTYTLIVDTGSSNTWCGARNRCEPSSTGRSTGDEVEVSYGSGSFSGTEYIDHVSFGGLTVNSQSIGSASSSSGFSGVDGIIGFGPTDLTEGTVQGQNEVPTFMDNLKSQGSIAVEVLGVSFVPEPGSSTSSANGELTLGGTDPSKYTGSITYFPRSTSGANAPYWGANVQAFKYGTATLGGAASGIVDTGTTLIYIPTASYNKFLSDTHGTTDSSSGLSSFTTAPTQTFGIEIAGKTYTLTPSQYLVPQAQYSYFGLSQGKYYSWINNGGSSGVNTIIGQKFLENYYAVFDTTNSRIGFAPRSSSA